uniref:ATP synthase F0 subunit 6 n=1 Tax=Antonbruunia milenae TaxID=3053535 RepID=UPI0030E5E115
MSPDIFSSFDPCIYFMGDKLSLGFWGLSVVPILLMSSSFWLNPNQSFWGSSLLIETMYSQSMRTSGKYIKGFSNLIMGVFFFTISMNLYGLVPYVFSFSSHLLMTLSLGLPLWLSIIFSSYKNSPFHFTSGLLPGGAPGWLNPFLVIVESSSILVRPITLSFRLVANMSAGHIVLCLMGSFTCSLMTSNGILFLFLLFMQVSYLVFEVGICLIQAYIFCLLLTLYMDEHTSWGMQL